ncbi:hypothetical protein ACO1L6_14285, partial [Staphylococcus aureus]
LVRAAVHRAAVAALLGERAQVLVADEPESAENGQPQQPTTKGLHGHFLFKTEDTIYVIGTRPFLLE